MPQIDINLRAARAEDVAFARGLYFETMRWIVERLFGWDQAREEQNFTRFFKVDEVKIITAGGRDVGWIQEQNRGAEIFLGSFYVTPAPAAARHRLASSSHNRGMRQESMMSTNSTGEPIRRVV